MARCNLTLSAKFRPAFDALVDVAICIAETHGADTAEEWLERVMSDDVALFVRLSVESRPQLHVIAGGKA